MKITEIIEMRRFKIEGLKEDREACGLLQCELANLLGISRQYMWDLEKGHRMASRQQIEAIKENLKKKAE